MRRFFQIVLVLLLLIFGGGGWYLYHKGLTKSWRDYVIDELRRHGVEASFSRLTVEPFRGLVAKDVKIYQTAERKELLARVDEMIVEANYAHAIRGQTFVDALTLTDASLQILMDSKQPNGPSVKVEKLSTRILLPPNQLLVARLEAVVSGIKVTAAGQLANPDAWVSKSTSGEKQDSSFLPRLCRELDALTYSGAAPRLDLRFSGDLASPDTLLVEGQLAAGRTRHGDYEIESLNIIGSWQNGALVIPRVEAVDAKGRLQFSGSYVPETQVAELRLRSRMDLAALARTLSLAPALGELAFLSQPWIELSAKATFGKVPSYEAMGHVELGKFSYGRVPFERLNADFSWDGRRWAVRNLALQHKTGELTGEMQQVENDFRLGLISTLSPAVFAPLLKGELAARMAQLKFPDAPRIELTARGPSPGADTLSASGNVQLGRCSYRGIEAKRAEAQLRFNRNILSVDNLKIYRTEGTAMGGMAFDFSRAEVHIDKIRMALHPHEVVLWVDPEIIDEIVPYRFGKRPPNLVIDGLLDTRKDGKNTQLTVDVDAPGGMDYTFCKKDLHFQNVTGRLFFTDERLKFNDVRATIFGGAVKAEADISIMKGRPGHTSTMRVSDVDFSSLTKLYFDYDDSKGKLNAVYSFDGRGDEGRSMRGEGQMTVTDGNVFAIPFLGPFSDILDKIVPGMGSSAAEKASASFAIAEGVVTTKDFLVQGKGFSMIGDGRIWFLDDKIDFDVRINARGLPGVLLFPVSKLFEYRADTKFSKPNWHPKMIPKLGPSP